MSSRLLPEKQGSGVFFMDQWDEKMHNLQVVQEASPTDDPKFILVKDGDGVTYRVTFQQQDASGVGKHTGSSALYINQQADLIEQSIQPLSSRQSYANVVEVADSDLHFYLRKK